MRSTCLLVKIHNSHSLSDCYADDTSSSDKHKTILEVKIKLEEEAD